MAYSGSCHCEAVKFEVAAEPPTETISCNCSHCRQKGMLLTFLPEHALRTVTGEAELTTYGFNKYAIDHKFCRICGVQPFATGTGPDGSRMAAINLRSVSAIDLDSLVLKKIDGASF